MAINSRPGKWVTTLIVILLYSIPLYQKYSLDTEDSWQNLRIIEFSNEKAHSNETPFYAENFVNQAKPGVICHVSSIAVAGENRLICTWYAGSKEGAQDVAIYHAFFQEDTGTWSEPLILLDRQRSSSELRRWVRKVGNAAVINDNRGKLWLFYASLLGGWSTSSLNYKVSQDEGRTWSTSRKLMLSPFFNLTNNVKNKGLSLSHGALLIPVYHEFLHKFSQVLLFVPENPDLPYQVRRMTHAGSAIQPALIPRDGKNLAAFFRNAAGQGNSYILRAESRNVGQHWSDLTNTPLPHPNSGFDMVRLTDGGVLGVINHAFQDRNDLTLVLSHDEGKTWNKLRILENKPEKEYAYPSLTRTKNYYHLTYSYERNRIKHVVFNEAWLKELKEHDN